MGCLLVQFSMLDMLVRIKPMQAQLGGEHGNSSATLYSPFPELLFLPYVSGTLHLLGTLLSLLWVERWGFK